MEPFSIFFLFFLKYEFTNIKISSNTLGNALSALHVQEMVGTDLGKDCGG